MPEKRDDSKDSFMESWVKYYDAKERKNQTETFVCAVDCRAKLQKIAGDGHTPEKESEIMQSCLGEFYTEQQFIEMYQELYKHSRSYSGK